MDVTTLEVRHDDLETARLHQEPVPTLEPGQALLRVDRFGLSANNVTYGALGDRLGYWRFFPTAEPGWGRIPAWGFATAIAGALPAGTRAFGYVPMASHVVLTPGKPSERGFLESSPHRATLPKAYNAYANPASDPVYDPAHEDAQVLLRPVFVLSFLLDHALDAKHESVLVTSASSKAALGFARLQAERGVRVEALTSQGNRAFVEGVRVYDAIHTYDDPPDDAELLVDIAGNSGQIARRTIKVGITHRPQQTEGDFFSAAEELGARRSEWGSADFDRRFAAAFHQLVEWSEAWLRMRHPDDPLAAYAATVNGDARPDEGIVLTLDPEVTDRSRVGR